MPAFLAAPLPITRPRLCTGPTLLTPRCALQKKTSSAPPSPLLQSIAARLQEELPTLFTSEPDYTIYSPSVTFEDPLNKFRGISKYAANVAFLNSSPVFTNAQLTLHHISIITTDTVRTRWTLSMVINLPWAPCVAFTGQSDYVVDLHEGKVVSHYDYWDSLQHSKFFSFPALLDLVTQCRLHIGPRDLGGFDLLRRTNEFEIRRFADAITLERVHGSRVEAWLPGAGDVPIQSVAVLTLPNPPARQSDVLDGVARLRTMLEGKTFATPGDKYYYVTPKLRGSAFHEIWLELSDANAFVDT